MIGTVTFNGTVAAAFFNTMQQSEQCCGKGVEQLVGRTQLGELLTDVDLELSVYVRGRGEERTGLCACYVLLSAV